MMESKDVLHDEVRLLRRKLDNQPFPESKMEPYREVRQLTADVVHATQAEGIDDRMAMIAEKNKALAEKVAAMHAE